MENLRYNISPCSPEEAADFIAKIDERKYIPRSTVKADDRSHYDRYSYTCNDLKVAVVYDTTAQVISITAPRENADELRSVFSPDFSKIVKRSTVPAQGQVPQPPQQPTSGYTPTGGTRSKVFVSPKHINNNRNVSGATVLVTAKGAEVWADEIFPPQRAKNMSGQQNRRPIDYSSQLQNRRSDNYMPEPPKPAAYYAPEQQSSNKQFYGDGMSVAAATSDGSVGRASRDNSGMNLSVGGATLRPNGVRRATISFGEEDDSKSKYDAQSTPIRSGTGLFADIGTNAQDQAKPGYTGSDTVVNTAPVKRGRGRPPKSAKPTPTEVSAPDNSLYPEPPPDRNNDQDYKNGYSVKNYSQSSLDGVLKSLRSVEKYKVSSDGTEFAGTPQEVKTYSVADDDGQKVVLRYAVGKKTIQLQGKRSELFGEVQSMVSRDTDYSSAMEDYVDGSSSAGGSSESKVSQVQARLKKRLPTAYEYLSEQSRIDFSYGVHDFEQASLSLLDYSVLLVPPYRGLERFVFDLQRAEGINVKMIGQAYDKDETGRYILKRGYQNRIGSIVYSEVMVSLYNEYFSRRNFFAHSDNTGGNASRSIEDRAVAKRIFDNLLNVVEYNARKLKEIGFTMNRDNKSQQ